MTRSAVARRPAGIPAQDPDECPACRLLPPIVILHDDEPAPPDSLPQCGRVYGGVTCEAGSNARLISYDRRRDSRGART